MIWLQLLAVALTGLAVSSLISFVTGRIYKAHRSSRRKARENDNLLPVDCEAGSSHGQYYYPEKRPFRRRTNSGTGFLLETGLPRPGGTVPLPDVQERVCHAVNYVKNPLLPPPPGHYQQHQVGYHALSHPSQAPQHSIPPVQQTLAEHPPLGRPPPHRPDAAPSSFCPHVEHAGAASHAMQQRRSQEEVSERKRRSQLASAILERGTSGQLAEASLATYSDRATDDPQAYEVEPAALKTVRARGLRHSSPIYKREKMLSSTDHNDSPERVPMPSGDDTTSNEKLRRKRHISGERDSANTPELSPSASHLHSFPSSQSQSRSHSQSGQRSRRSGSGPGHCVINYSDLEMHELIGGGGFGQVYKARWRGTAVAVKVLLPAAQSGVDEAMINDFRGEVEMLAALRHPNIVMIMAACVDPPHRAIVTELVSRGSLWGVLRDPQIPHFTPAASGSKSNEGARQHVETPPGQWPWQLMLKVAEGCACGMNYLHCNSPPIVHRDLKSANLLLDDSCNPKICDFGLARLKAYTNSMTGNCGTVQWMAPEVLANQKYVCVSSPVID
ncbi:unnamed protein product [Chrysoparadoxa australica]